MRHNGRNGQSRCPVCRKHFQIPAGGADDFPKNFFMNRCVDALTTVIDAGTGARSKSEQASRSDIPEGSKCSNDDDGDDCTQPERFCLVCCEYYCKACARMHSKLKATRSHEQVAVEKLTDEMIRAAMASTEVPRCLKHDEELKLYCSDCKSAVCSQCVPTTHKSHNFQRITEVDEESKSELREMMQTVQQLMSSMDAQVEHIRKSEENLDSSTSTAQANLKAVFQNMHEMLSQKVKEVGQEITKVKEEGTCTAGIQTKNLTLNVQLLDSLLSFMQDVMEKGTVFNRLACLPEIRSRVQQFQSSTGDGDTNIDVPSSTDLLRKHLDGLVLKQKVKLGGGSGAALIMNLAVECHIEHEKVGCSALGGCKYLKG